ncbi:MAG: type ISP restriction/modification enzyme [Ignavibacteria bacterium]|nr:type ISP restriction/modification enzyme [Ignavibacteria bacterium]
MKTTFENYLNSVSKKFNNPETSEMGYRTDFEILLKDIFQTINVTRFDHDPKAKGGNKPDFVILKFDIPILYIETKDIGISLDKIEKSQQMVRYFGYMNLVLTDYLEFRFYRNGQRYDEPIKIADYDLHKRTISYHPQNFEHLSKTLVDFTLSQKEPIKNGLHLAKIMGGKAQRIRENLLRFLSNDSEKNSEIKKIYKTLQKLLVHDLNDDSFADMYAQTLVYGLFVARYHDTSPENFSRREARELVPKSNPFLRHFFDHIVGPDFDKRLEFIVDELCEVFSHANLPELMKQYFRDDLWGNSEEGSDPVIHFYEDFLREYDADLRKKLGAYYTPQPVVKFIVRSVDYLLSKEFGLFNGLADTTKTESGIHKVQILDPAVGTGTFLSAVITNIYQNLKDRGQIGRWTTYVHHDLLPRIHGFEIMMAPYTIAHLKLSMAFKATGFKHFNKRLGIYLTNSLEEADNKLDLFTGFGFAESIAEESKEAAQIKNDTPIMVVIGNPPYSVSSSNKGKWITDLIKVYKKDLNERKINLDDDYIKFIRYAEHHIEKNGSGIVAMITNNSFLDGITHRQMRKHLLETFDKIYILDLHGNAKKKETAPDGSKDENVFDIMQGVSISIMIRKNEKKDKPAVVKFAELYGKREVKFKELIDTDIDVIKWDNIEIQEPNFFFVPKDFKSNEVYKSWIKLDELMNEFNSGIQSKRDKICFPIKTKELLEIIRTFELNEESLIRSILSLPIDGRDWTIKWAKKDLLIGYEIKPILYRPFDIRDSAYTGRAKGFLAYPREKTFKHFLKDNYGIITVRQQSTFDFQHILVTKNMIESGAISLQTKEWGYIFPLYLYSEDGSKVPNLNQGIVKEIEKITGKTEPEEILDYIYAVLHSPSYREKYKEFLKIDFPRVPYPKDKTTFKKLVNLGTELRELHLLESPVVNKFITTFPKDGTCEVEKITYIKENGVSIGEVWINSEQYFGKVPETAWNLYIGGYQPAQKWLKDRKGRVLTNEDIEHYQKIIIALSETDRIMKEINKIEFC